MIQLYYGIYKWNRLYWSQSKAKHDQIAELKGNLISWGLNNDITEARLNVACQCYPTGTLNLSYFPSFSYNLILFFVFVNSFSFIRWWVLSVVKYIVQASREFPFPTLSSNTIWKISRNRWKFSFRVSFLFFFKWPAIT